MFFLLGLEDKIMALPTSCHLSCPTCGQSVAFQITWIYHYIHLFFIPIVAFGHRYIATCGGCATPFALNTKTGHAFRRGKYILTQKDLFSFHP